jgi:AcrR family transcriptional regulator
MLTAAVQIVGELGYGGMSVARITGRAGVSRRTFYDLFEDREDCFLAAFEEAVARASAVAVEAAAGQGAWRERVREGLCALLVFFDDEPGLASLVMVDALGAGQRVLERRSRVLETLGAIIDEGRGEAKAGHEAPSLTAEGVVGAVLAVVHARILEKGHPRLVGLLSPLMGVIVLPYLGRAAAARELARPAPKVSRALRASRASRAPRRDPLEGLDMRLTYRTLRVLAAIAEQPGASNRHVGEHAGVHDQGQISKLLARLEGLGLLDNTGGGHLSGEPNAWRLTRRGVEVERATRMGGSEHGDTEGVVA